MHSWTSRCPGCPDRLEVKECGCHVWHIENCNPYGGSKFLGKRCLSHTITILPASSLIEQAQQTQAALIDQIEVAKQELKLREENKAKMLTDDIQLQKLKYENQRFVEELARLKAQLSES